MTNTSKQEILAQRSCPACFGSSLPDTNPHPNDTHYIFICLDGNFQHQHHEHASKDYLLLQVPDSFLEPKGVKEADQLILIHEQAQKKTQYHV